MTSPDGPQAPLPGGVGTTRARAAGTEPVRPRHADSIVSLYERHAHAWVAGRTGPVFEAPWLERFRALMPPAGTVLDIGCGSGVPIAAYLIERGHAVTGVDASPTMIETCRRRFPAAAWQVSDMRTLALDSAFAGIVAWDSFFHLCPDDQRRMFPIFRSHALPGAALMFTSGPAYGEAIGTFEGEPLYHGSLDAAEYRELLAAEGFKVVTHVVDDPTCGRHTVWLAQLTP